MVLLLFVSLKTVNTSTLLTVVMILSQLYTILADGSLELLEIVPTHGQTPRDLIDTGSRICHCCPSDSDNATVFKRNPETGRLAELSNDFHVPEAVCISFAN